MHRPTILHAPLAVLAFLVFGTPSSAQNAPDRWRAEAELGFNGASGNSSFTILRTGLKAKHLQTDVAEFEASVLVRYGTNDEKVIADDAKASLKLDLWPQARFSPFVFADGARDRIRKLDGRFSGGAGGKWSVWQEGDDEASFSVAALYDYQNFQVVSPSTGSDSESFARWSVRTKVAKKISDSATFEHVAVWQPVWDHAGDYVLDLTHSVSTRVLANISLAVEHQYLRDSRPPTDVSRDDQRFSVLLKMTF